MSEHSILFKGRFFCGFILRMKTQKTIVVKIERFVQHVKYKKFFLRYTTLLVHNVDFFCSVGDKVLIRECSPISKMKNFLLVDILFRSVRGEKY